MELQDQVLSFPLTNVLSRLVWAWGPTGFEASQESVRIPTFFLRKPAAIPDDIGCADMPPTVFEGQYIYKERS